MSYSYSESFTIAHARHLASKVVSDLYQCSLLYDRPGLERINAYQEELIVLLAGGYVEAYEFGFKKNGGRVLSWYYTVGPAGDLQSDSRSGSLKRGVYVTDAEYFNFLTYSNSWSNLGPAEKATVEEKLPFQRPSGSAPADGNGYWEAEHGYTAGGVLVQRKAFRPW